MRQVVFVVFILLNVVLLFSQPAFPGAQGFGASASGGRGGKVIYVTNLNISGPGSLQEALNETGPRYILFKVSGVIPGTIKIPNGNGNFSIAGQTSPGGIIVRGLEAYNEQNPSVENIIIRHLRSRIGDRIKFPTPNWLADDGITLGGVRRAIIDHCSFQHAGDEAVDISRSSLLTLQNCVLGETLGGHANLGGMLINYSDATSQLDSLSIHHNVWNRIGGRMPEISCETPYCNGKTINLEVSNNLFWDPKIELWYEGLTGFNDRFYVKMNAVNNLYHGSSQYGNGMYHYDFLLYNQNQLYFSGNRMNLYPNYSDYQLFYCCNDFNTNHPNMDIGVASRSNSRFPFPAIEYTPTESLSNYINNNAGAFPRDAMDSRLMGYIQNNQILPLPVDLAGADDAFLFSNGGDFPDDSDLDGMPDYWENNQGLHLSQQDHNGSELSLKITGEQGYTNLECYLHCLSEALVNRSTTSECGITGFTTSSKELENKPTLWNVFPNPVTDILHVHMGQDIEFKNMAINISNLTGENLWTGIKLSNKTTIDVNQWPAGIYFVELVNNDSGESLEKTKIIVVR